MSRKPLSPDVVAARKNLLPGLLIIGSFLAYLFVSAVLEERADEKRKEQRGWHESTRTIRTLQIDESSGEVIRSEEETVHGLENRRGEFYPRPD